MCLRICFSDIYCDLLFVWDFNSIWLALTSTIYFTHSYFTHTDHHHHHQTDLPLSSLDLSYDGSQSPGSGIGGSGGGGGGMGSDGSGCGGGMGGHGMSAHSRSKRMRTSFKHHQLRTMKSYFAINQNPDAKDLKQLAQKTGLSKRVLQVSRAETIMFSDFER